MRKNQKQSRFALDWSLVDLHNFNGILAYFTIKEGNMSKVKIAIIVALIFIPWSAFAQTLTVITSSGDVQITMEICAKFDYKPGDIVSYSGIPGIILGEASGNLWIAAAGKVYQITDTTRINKLTKYPPNYPCYIQSRRTDGANVRLDISPEATDPFYFNFGDRAVYPGHITVFRTVIGVGLNPVGDRTLHTASDENNGRVTWADNPMEELANIIQEQYIVMKEDGIPIPIDVLPESCLKFSKFKPGNLVRDHNSTQAMYVLGCPPSSIQSLIGQKLWVRELGKLYLVDPESLH
jgi:hypothetical protein